MREIKFRAWDKESLYMFFPPELIFNKDGELIYIGLIPNLGHADFPSERYKLMQFTGLLDKNDKEVYEGDIVNVKYTDGSGYDNPVEVSFENGSFWVGSGYLNDIKIIEVIGNIYETPELLNS
jgi:uncharacterized phage protein (TIGR01671 family)